MTRVGNDAAYEMPLHTSELAENNYMELSRLNGVNGTLGLVEAANSRNLGNSEYEIPLNIRVVSTEEQHFERLQFTSVQNTSVEAEGAANRDLHEDQNIGLTQPEGVYDYVTVYGVTTIFEYIFRI